MGAATDADDVSADASVPIVLWRPGKSVARISAS